VENQVANHARLGNIDYPVIRAKLRAWLVLENVYNSIFEASISGNREQFVDSLYSYISYALYISEEELKSCPWYEVTRAFRQIYIANRPSHDFPMLRSKENSNLEIAWDYLGRDWFTWIHILAREYGWDIKYIENLDVDDGIALLQEILINNQLRKEWEWSLSEKSVSYNEQTRISKFIPLERPDWMRPIPRPIQKTKMKVSQLPIGLVLKWNEKTSGYIKS